VRDERNKAKRIYMKVRQSGRKEEESELKMTKRKRNGQRKY
jgi:hypothetical protein